ncbi:unnamed protein product, partial [Rotaria sp. Silwood1]
ERRQEDVWGDRPCDTDPCPNRTLEHIVIFHARDYKPQPRWRELNAVDPNATYIGFHTTTSQAAVGIAHSEFRPSSSGMLGSGAYFARSVEDTIGKANSYGAWIIAEIRMGKVFEINKKQIYPRFNNPHYNANLHHFVQSGGWHKEYDTCYLNHEMDRKDEFCIKNPQEQIIKWVIVIERQNDAKVSQYGLDTEFDSTKCGCI